MNAVLAGMGAMATVAAVDLVLVDPFYLGLLRLQVIGIFLAVALIVAAGAVFGARFEGWGREISRLSHYFAILAGSVVALFSVFVYLVRPYVSQVLGSPYGLEIIQAERGLPLEPLRTYAEWSAHWLAWYVGPILLVGAIGWSLMAARAAEGEKSALVTFLLIFSIFALLYVWKPSINPDQLWAMRRFLPIVIPGLLICAGWVVDRLVDFSWTPTWLARLVPIILATVMVLGPLRTTAPLAFAHEYDGLAADFTRACDVLGANAAVLVVDRPDAVLGPRLVQGLRSYCDIPAAYADTPIPLKRVDELSAAWAADGRDLWMVSWMDSGAEDPNGVVLFNHTYQVVELTLTRAPKAMSDFPLRVWAIRAEP